MAEMRGPLSLPRPLNLFLKPRVTMIAQLSTKTFVPAVAATNARKSVQVNATAFDAELVQTAVRGITLRFYRT